MELVSDANLYREHEMLVLMGIMGLTGLVFDQVDYSVQRIIHPVSIDGKPMGQVVEVGDILCFVNDRPIKKVIHYDVE